MSFCYWGYLLCLAIRVKIFIQWFNFHRKNPGPFFFWVPEIMIKAWSHYHPKLRHRWQIVFDSQQFCYGFDLIKNDHGYDRNSLDYCSKNYNFNLVDNLAGDYGHVVLNIMLNFDNDYHHGFWAVWNKSSNPGNKLYWKKKKKITFF